MSTPANRVAIIPDVPRDPQVVDNNGNLTPVWSQFLDQLVTALQFNLKNEGYVLPQVPDTDIAVLTGVQSLANILYDSTNNVFKGNILTAPNTYTWKTFDMS